MKRRPLLIRVKWPFWPLLRCSLNGSCAKFNIKVFEEMRACSNFKMSVADKSKIKGGGTCEVMFCVWWWKNRVSHIQKINHKVRFQYLYVDLLPVLSQFTKHWNFHFWLWIPNPSTEFTNHHVICFDSSKVQNWEYSRSLFWKHSFFSQDRAPAIQFS